MKKTLIVTAFILSAVLASAVWTGCKKEEPANQLGFDTTATIKGVVMDFADQLPISGANVNITPSGMSANTDSVGCFQFTDLDAGQYTIIVFRTGYQTNRKTVSAIAGKTMNISISMSKLN